jgi:hypothetical protein
MIGRTSAKGPRVGGALANAGVEQTSLEFVLAGLERISGGLVTPMPRSLLSERAVRRYQTLLKQFVTERLHEEEQRSV